MKELRTCEWCGNTFEIIKSNKKRFCSTRCSAFWRNKYYGPNLISEETKQKNAQILKKRWEDPEFRAKKVAYMINNNPTYNANVVQKIKKTCIEKNVYKNHFKYGNGKLSKYESLVYDRLINLGFIYNYAIGLKLALDTFPERNYPKNYKPDFTHLQLKICIEIDGNNHMKKHQKELDMKKDECLKFLGFKVIRFTHEQIDNGEFNRWVETWQN